MKTLQSIAYYLRNKTVSLLVLAAAVTLYNFLPSGVPFTELMYKAITVLGVVTLAPVLRLMVFNEAAVYAETGQLSIDLAAGKITPNMIQYWFGTAICYLVPIACIAGIQA
jgi:hypothetical protein